MARILVIEDDPTTRRFLAQILQEEGHQVAEGDSVAAGLRTLASEPLDLVLTDQRLPDGEGLQVLRASREADPTLPVVLITAYASFELAVDAMREGAFDFVAKPFTAEELLVVVRRAWERTQVVRENVLLREELRRREPAARLVGKSAAIREVREQIARVAPTQATVLITGETGTGKELVAREVHQQSRRADQPFVAINCAAFAETLLESELYGHERGAFTGATQAKKGLFEAAHGGSLFLDEAGEMSLALQAKLLRVLTDHQVIRVGATQARTVDVRILVATHRDLPSRIREGQFRDDLYYRLAVFPLAIPPLRQRRGDIPLLTEHFLEKAACELKIPRRHMSTRAMEKLMRYSFPGNIRELANLIERACILSRGVEIDSDDLPLSDDGNGELHVPDLSTKDPLEEWVDLLPPSLHLRETLERFERLLLQRALKETGGVQAEAARRLRISRSDMAYKVRKYDLNPGAGLE
ncbi:MAG: sigma-54 dependent transcriptional regulator [Candidatus Latescibacterota bacterium]